MNTSNILNGEYIHRESGWASTCEVVADPVKFAEKFNRTVPGAYKSITGDDIRRMTHCGLIGRYGFFLREDVETVRGVLRYEQLKDTAKTQSVRVS
jgi:hypothetical protein